MRLDKFLSHATGLTRNQSRRLLKEERVRVNRQAVSQPALHLAEQDRVELDGAPLALPEPLYLMLHKPAGYVCANTDADHPTVMDLLSSSLCSPSQAAPVSVAGRLDLDSTGLVLLSNDGDWVHKVISPRHSHPKVYRVTLEQPVSADTVHQFQQGMMLRNDTTPTRPAGVELLFETEARVTLTEGRYHQVKRMFAACGNRVLSLHRHQIGPVLLDPSLAPGDSRALTAEEIAGFQNP